MSDSIEKQNIPESLDFKNDTFLLGDSITEGIKAGREGEAKSGEQTLWMRKVASTEIPKIKPKVVFLLGGTNDVASGVPVNETIENIRAIALTCKDNNSKLVIGTVPPMKHNDRTLAQRIEIDKKVKELNHLIKTDLSLKELGVEIIDYNSIFSDGVEKVNFKGQTHELQKLKSDLYSGDGIHPNRSGQNLIIDAQKQKFEELQNLEERINKDFEKYFSENVENQDWFQKITPEKQEEIRSLYSQKYNLERRLTSYDSKFTLGEMRHELDEDSDELTYEDRVYALEIELAELQNSLNEVELSLNKENLEKYIEKKQPIFEEDLKDEKYNSFTEYIENKDLKDIKAGEIYSLKLSGYDLSKLFLMGNGEISKENMKEGDKFTVNFGGNKNLNRKIGAGDLLPIEKFEVVKINGIEGTRANSPRPGYYDKNGRYLAIFDNYKIEIVSEKKISDDEVNNYKQSFEKRYSEIRTPEIINLLFSSGNQSFYAFNNLMKKDFDLLVDYIKGFGDDINKSIEINSENQTIDLKDRKKLSDVLAITTSKNLGEAYKKYSPIIMKVTAGFPNISPENLITLINHENRNWDPYIKAVGSSAYGLGQMIDGTWEKFGSGLDRNNPEHQLIATCKYLEYLMNQKSCNINLAMAYYNTGEGILGVGPETFEKVCKYNGGIVKRIKGDPVTPKNYFIAAVSYYNDTTYEHAKALSNGQV